MNRLSKESTKNYIRERIKHLSYNERKEFLQLFAPDSNANVEETINFLNGKSLRKAYKFIRLGTKL